MKINYYNPKTRHNGEIKETYRHLDTTPVYCCRLINKNGFVSQHCGLSMTEADKIMTENGYIRRGFIDNMGCFRHTMTWEQLHALYKDFETFVADCTKQEYNENKAAIMTIMSLIHQRQNAAAL